MRCALGSSCFAFALLLLAACETPPPAVPTKGPAASSCLSIASWNDLHGQLVPDEVQLEVNRVPAGGIVALADQLAAVRATGDAVVTLDAGDLFTGPLESTLAEGAPVIDAYNVMGVDAAAVGNHEFDFGPVGYARVVAAPNVGDEGGADGPRGALLARMAAARFPFLSANVHRTGGGALGYPHLLPSTHVRRGGFDVGVVGYSTVDTPITTLKPNIVGLDFATNAAASVAAEVHALRASGASPIVLLAHASLDGVLPQELDDGSDPEGQKRTGELATLVDRMPEADRPDLVIAGHRHHWMVGRLRGIPIVSSLYHGVGLTQVRYCRAPGATTPRLERIDRRVALPSTTPSTPLGHAVATTIAPWLARVQEQADRVITTLARPCPSRAADGTALAEQNARAIAEQCGAAAPAPPGVPVVAFVNAGMLRVPLRAGPVRFRDVFATAPFENGVAVCATTRRGLERTIANSIRSPEAREQLTFGIAGAKVLLARGADRSLTVRRVLLDGAVRGVPERDDDRVWLAVPDFILWGGDALLDGVECTSSATSQLHVRDAWRAALAREQACDGPPKNVVIEGP